jgi:hypothetical protein
MKSLLLKRKPSAGNAPKPPAEKRRKPSTLHVQLVRSPTSLQHLKTDEGLHSYTERKLFNSGLRNNNEFGSV